METILIGAKVIIYWLICLSLFQGSELHYAIIEIISLAMTFILTIPIKRD